MRSLHLAFYKSTDLTPPAFEHNDSYDIFTRSMEYYGKQFSIQHNSHFTCVCVNFWTILSFPTFILRVDRVNLRSSMSQPINSATCNKPLEVRKRINVREVLNNLTRLKATICSKY